MVVVVVVWAGEGTGSSDMVGCVEVGAEKVMGEVADGWDVTCV